MSDVQERRERGGRLCADLAARVSSTAPRGLGLSPETWRIVDPPSAEFMIALAAWEASGTSEAKERLAAAFAAVVRAWAAAADAFLGRRAPSDTPPKRRT